MTGAGSQETVVSGLCLTQVNLRENHFPSLGLDFLMGKIREVAAEYSSTSFEIRVPLPHTVPGIPSVEHY